MMKRNLSRYRFLRLAAGSGLAAAFPPSLPGSIPKTWPDALPGSP